MTNILLAIFVSGAVAAPAPVTTPDSARMRAELAVGDSLEGVGRYNDARRRYRAIITEQLSTDQYPAEALWHLANNYFFHDDILKAATTLEELAGAAAHFGDPAMELRASFEAAVLYQKSKRPDRVAANLVRVRSLLKSPAIAADLKRDVESRMVNG